MEVLGCEYDSRGPGLRALVLTDAEQASAVPDGSLASVLRPESGTAPEAVRALAADVRTAPLRPLLVSGRGLRCAEGDADVLLDAIRTLGPAELTGWRAAPDDGGLLRLHRAGAAWRPRLWVGLATRAFVDGGDAGAGRHRALLGEGWDAPCVNCLVDLSAATTSVSVTQMRGRSLRLDPGDPEKIASNWDVVCVAPELARGTADYERFVRKHVHLFAPTEDGVIEAGPSHVHPALGPFAPPSSDDFDEVNRAMAQRSIEHERARERWRLGEPYVGEERQTLVVRPRRALRRARAGSPPVYPIRQRAPFAVAATAAGVSIAASATDPSLLVGLAAVPAALAWAGTRLGRVRQELGDVLPLDLAARAVCDAYVALGELRPESAATLAIEPRASGYLRCFLRDATPEESARFTDALDKIVSPSGSPRYLVSRLVPGSRGPLALLGLALVRRPPFGHRWEPVPDDLGRRKDRAVAFATAWRRWLGPSELRFTQRSTEGRAALSASNAQSSDYETSARRIWV